MEKSLDELLDEPNETQTDVQETEPETVQEPEQVEQEAQSLERDEKGRFAKKGEESASPAPVEKKEEFDGAATIGERRRRQEAEDRIAELERQLQSFQNPPAPPPSMWEDEKGWQQHFGQQITNEATQFASLNAKLDMSEMLAGQAHTDFDEKKAVFLELVQSNPELRQTAMQDRHPWEKAYQIATNHTTMQEMQATNMDELRAKIRAEIEAEMGGQAPTRPTAPPTLSTQRNVGARSGPEWSGPPSLSDLLR